ncbi:MAG: hypothetical protein KY439_03780 [Actinobacteria bacterium]|nr:hypothetical protein [Actinomycetota bacterium]
MSQPDRQELRPQLRAEAPPGDAVVVVRGGPTTLARLRDHARRTHDAYLLDGAPLWGVSVFCALDDIGTASLEGLLRRFASYRVVHLPRVGALTAAGFELLPSFGRPHFTIRLTSDSDEHLKTLLGTLGPGEANPYHGGQRPGRR